MSFNAAFCSTESLGAVFRVLKPTMSKLPVLIIEEHTEGLECLSLAVRRGIIELAKCQLIHFDSHPDLGCLELIEPRHLSNRQELCDILRNSEEGISTFLLPAISIGLISSVVWVKPPWSHQIPIGYYPKTTFGWQDNNQMYVATELTYWVDDGSSVSDVNILNNKTSFDLTVTEIGEWVIPTSKNWVLDICLDYFSCANPLQQPDLPDHISTQLEIEILLELFKNALLSTKLMPPRLVIIARSEHDGFTPDSVASTLETSVLNILEEVYSDTKVRKVQSYLDFYDPNFIRSV